MFGIYESGNMIAKFAAPLSLYSNVPTTASDAQSLVRTFYKSPAQRWELTADIMPLSSGAEDLFVMLVTGGSTEPVMISTPQNYGVMKRMRTLNSLAPTAAGTAQSDTVTITNNTGTDPVTGTPGQPNLIPKGTMLRFGSAKKVYMATSELSGNGVLQVFPRLLTNITALSPVYHRDDVMMTTYLDTDVVKGMVYSDGILMSPGQMKFVEDIRTS